MRGPGAAAGLEGFKGVRDLPLGRTSVPIVFTAGPRAVLREESEYLTRARSVSEDRLTALYLLHAGGGVLIVGPGRGQRLNLPSHQIRVGVTPKDTVRDTLGRGRAPSGSANPERFRICALRSFPRPRRAVSSPRAPGTAPRGRWGRRPVLRSDRSAGFAIAASSRAPSTPAGAVARVASGGAGGGEHDRGRRAQRVPRPPISPPSRAGARVNTTNRVVLNNRPKRAFSGVLRGGLKGL